MTAQRARTTPASTAGSFAPAAGRRSRQTAVLPPPTLRVFRDSVMDAIGGVDRETWLATIRAGDVVCYGEFSRSGKFAPICELVVTKVTTTQIVADSQRFRRGDGRTPGRSGALYTNRGIHASPPQTEDETDG